MPPASLCSLGFTTHALLEHRLVCTVYLARGGNQWVARHVALQCAVGWLVISHRLTGRLITSIIQLVLCTLTLLFPNNNALCRMNMRPELLYEWNARMIHRQTASALPASPHIFPTLVTALSRPVHALVAQEPQLD
jgi:hypothetical protein